MSKSSSSKSRARTQPRDIPDFNIPETMEEWEDLVARAKLDKMTINTLPQETFKSASQIPGVRELFGLPKWVFDKVSDIPEGDEGEEDMDMMSAFRYAFLSIFRYDRNIIGFGYVAIPRGLRAHNVKIPRTCRDAMEDPFKHHWESAMRVQINKLQERKASEQTMTIEEIHDRDRAEISPPASKRLRCRSDTTSRPGGEEAARKLKDLPDAKDEATPNAALVVFLQCLTGLVTGLPIECVLNRISFTPFFGKGGYNTVTDGVLRVSKTLAPLSIVEVKKMMRYKRTAAIIMQEGFELLGWLKESSHSLPAFNNHLLLVSQDRHKIFLTFAAYTQAYKEYLGGEEAKADSFLVMKAFGPWRTCDPAQMNEFGQFLLAIV
ncbi:hypothetical protein Aspvir_009227 [Aspergillus viridinutans]|uniref:Uncharacterized protein n=1 Tax=Aspergillus viridinutans TaxID=75553 RepID=A0A9P3F881_ASPVI|nr:uncharacterized protein Aspvir_009227 [Aspergillus viridinutans]GIK05125.1 hypothetical protein Aspvir_009227 [Aspergillus viridinutans]